MKPKTMILMAVAVVCGLGASYMTSRLLAERTTESPQEVEKVKIVVAKKNVPQGTFIKEPTDWFIEKEFTLGEEPKKACRTFDELKDKVLSKPLSAEQWVIADDLLRKDQVGLQANIPKGMRALTIRVSVDTVVGGFVQPNSRVDVINTVKGGDKEGYSQTILQNMLVVAIDTLDTRDSEKKAIISSNVTLAVTPEEAETLSLAQQMGELRLSLRNNEDNEKSTIRTLKPDDIRLGRINAKKDGSEEEGGGSSGPAISKIPDVGMADPPMNPPTEPAPEPVKTKPHKLTIINGDSVTQVRYLPEEDDFQTEIRKTPDAGEQPKPKQPATQPASEGEKKGAEPEKSAPTPTPDTPRKPKKASGS
jgi:pilus assembly protein CpaB